MITGRMVFVVLRRHARVDTLLESGTRGLSLFLSLVLLGKKWLEPKWVLLHQANAPDLGRGKHIEALASSEGRVSALAPFEPYLCVKNI